MNDFEINSTTVETAQFITEQTARLCELEQFKLDLTVKYVDSQFSKMDGSLSKTLKLLDSSIEAQQRIVESAILSLSESA